MSVAVDLGMFGRKADARNAGRKSACLALVWISSLASVVGVSTPAAAEPLCVYFFTVDTCALTGAAPCLVEGADACGGGGVRKFSAIVASGATSSFAEIQWSFASIDLPVPCQWCAPDAPKLPGARDFGTFAQEWWVIYEGDAECVKIEGDYWHSQGFMYLIYYRWSWLGDASSGGGERPGYVAGGWIEGTYLVDAEASNQPECDGLRQVAWEAAKATATVYAATHFGKWVPHLGVTGSVSWNVGALSTCLTGPLLDGLDTVSGNAELTMPPGDRLAATFKIHGSGTLLGNPVTYTGDGDTKLCILQSLASGAE